jgi:hypothetical protein
MRKCVVLPERILSVSTVHVHEHIAIKLLEHPTILIAYHVFVLII